MPYSCFAIFTAERSEFSAFSIRSTEIIIPTISTFAAAAGKYGSDSYKELVSAKRDFPNYTVIITKTSHRKENYKGLTLEVMKKYIIAHSSADSEQITTICLHMTDIHGKCVPIASTA